MHANWSGSREVKVCGTKGLIQLLSPVFIGEQTLPGFFSKFFMKKIQKKKKKLLIRNFSKYYDHTNAPEWWQVPNTGSAPHQLLSKYLRGEGCHPSATQCDLVGGVLGITSSSVQMIRK